MTRITKILLVAFASLTLTANAIAGELSITGAANARYRVNSSDSAAAKQNLGKGLGVTNEFSLGASGELDNGMTWNYGMDIDPGQVNSTAGGVDYDDAKLTLTTDYGTVGMFISEGSLSAKYGWDVSAYGVATDTGDGFGFIHPTNISSYDNIQYHLPADMLPYGITAKVAHSFDGTSSYSSGGTPVANSGATAEMQGVTEYKVTATPLDGLDVGANYIDFSTYATESEKEGGAWYAKYSMGPVEVGYGESYMTNNISTLSDAYAAAANTALAGYESVENTSYGIGFAVNDDLSISWTHEESNPDAQTAATATYTMEIESLQAAYTMGGMTISVSQDSASNTDYVTARDEKETLLAVSMAF
jgi:hypothetical protein